MTNLSEVPQLAMTFVFVAAVIVAGFLALSGLSEDISCSTGYEINGTRCQAPANVSDISGATLAGNTSFKIQEGMDNITDFASTWGTILGVTVLLGIVIGGFAFGKSKGWI